MADICEVTPEVLKSLEDWIAERGRPQYIIDAIRKFPPYKLFRMKSTGHRCTVMAYGEKKDGTGVSLRVSVDGRFNRVLFSRQVFGIDPNDLEECDLPAPGEDVGDTAAEAGYDDWDIKHILIPKLRERGEWKDCGHPGCDGRNHNHD